MMECNVGGGSLSLSFAESSPAVNAYRGELLSLMAAHLVLYSFTIVHGKFKYTLTALVHSGQLRISLSPEFFPHGSMQTYSKWFQCTAANYRSTDPSTMLKHTKMITCTGKL
jgi:hypothetical protein